MLDSLNELDKRASEWVRSSTARALARVGLGLSIFIWVAFAIVVARHDGNFDSLLVQVLFGLSFFAFIFVTAGVLHSGRNFIPGAEGKNPFASALVAFIVAGAIVFVVEAVRTSASTALIRGGVLAAVAGIARCVHVWRVNR